MRHLKNCSLFRLKVAVLHPGRITNPGREISFFDEPELSKRDSLVALRDLEPLYSDKRSNTEPGCLFEYHPSEPPVFPCLYHGSDLQWREAAQLPLQIRF